MQGRAHHVDASLCYPLHKDHEIFATIESFLDTEIGVDPETGGRETALGAAAESGNLQVTRLLLSMGADVNLVSLVHNILTWIH